MISLNDVTLSFGGEDLLSHISLHIGDTDRIGLVGKNGAGKSTLMKLLCGLQSPTSGTVEVPAGLKIGYLPQIMRHSEGRTVMEETMTAFASVLRMEDELARVSRELADRTDYDSAAYLALIGKGNELSDRIAMEKSEPLEVRAEKTLSGLGFRTEDFGRRTETFSQGWNMRIELAKILLQRPDVLLLDEPTNHLDIESIEWLETYLKGCRSALLLVSHDRRFLDTVTSRTVEILLGRLHDYKVPYSRYVELRAERLVQQTAAYENQQRMIAKTEEFIARFRYKPTKSNQVQSRIKALEKLERIAVDETDRAALTVKFPPSPRSGDVVFKATDLTAGYSQKVVFSGAEMEIRRGEKVAFIGRNGEGKTTMIKLMMGELEPISGEVRLGHHVLPGYFAQNQEAALDKRLTVSETLDRAAVGEIRLKLRDILAQFLFRGEDIDKRVSILSGGERSRLGMAKLMLEPHNLLVLDEPTNHMDIRSKDILRQALAAYDGTLVVVSHDRDFLNGLVGKLYEFRDGRVREHLGGVDEFLARRRMESLRELERGSRREGPQEAQRAGGTGKAGVQGASYKAGGGGNSGMTGKSGSRGTCQAGKTGKTGGGKAGSREDFEARKAGSREERKRRNRIAFLEERIEKIEAQMKKTEEILANPSENDDIMALTARYLEDRRDLDAFSEEWGRLIDTMDN